MSDLQDQARRQMNLREDHKELEKVLRAFRYGQLTQAPIAIYDLEYSYASWVVSAKKIQSALADLIADELAEVAKQISDLDDKLIR